MISLLHNSLWQMSLPSIDSEILKQKKKKKKNDLAHVSVY